MWPDYTALKHISIPGVSCQKKFPAYCFSIVTYEKFRQWIISSMHFLISVSHSATINKFIENIHIIWILFLNYTTWTSLWSLRWLFSLAGTVGGQTLAYNVQLALRGETHAFFIMAHGKSRAIDSTLFLLLCKQQRPLNIEVDANAREKEN